MTKAMPKCFFFCSAEKTTYHQTPVKGKNLEKGGVVDKNQEKGENEGENGDKQVQAYPIPTGKLQDVVVTCAGTCQADEAQSRNHLQLGRKKQGSRLRGTPDRTNNEKT